MSSVFRLTVASALLSCCPVSYVSRGFAHYCGYLPTLKSEGQMRRSLGLHHIFRGRLNLGRAQRKVYGAG